MHMMSDTVKVSNVKDHADQFVVADLVSCWVMIVLTCFLGRSRQNEAGIDTRRAVLGVRRQRYPVVEKLHSS